jgi:hypothetical protein
LEYHPLMVAIEYPNLQRAGMLSSDKFIIEIERQLQFRESFL